MPDHFDVFLSHNSRDKPAVIALAKRLKAQGLKVWLDAWELRPGHPWQEALEQIIETAKTAAVLVGGDGFGPWHNLEIRGCLSEFAEKGKMVIPVLLPSCPVEAPKLPFFLKQLTWVDLRDGKEEEGLHRLIWGITGEKTKEMDGDPDNFPNEFENIRSIAIDKTLGSAIDKAVSIGLNILCAPFHRPFQYIGMPIAAAAKVVGCTSNDVGNIIIDSDQAHMLLEAEGNFISYVDIQLKQTAPCSQTREFDSEPILGALSINPSELELVRTKTHYHIYYDHKRKLKVSVACCYEDSALSVGFSSKYYGM